MERERTRLKVKGDRINYSNNCETRTADIVTCKVLFNIVISTEGDTFMTMELKNFYLNTPLKQCGNVKLLLANNPDNVIEQYRLKERATSDRFFYVESCKGMYRLPHAELLA